MQDKDIQPQAEPYIVKSHDIHIDADYADWIAGTMHRYLFCAKNIEKLHQAGAELINPKLQQFVGELQFAINHGRIKNHQVGGDIQRLVSKSYSKIGMGHP